jgi:hypothetical protein
MPITGKVWAGPHGGGRRRPENLVRAVIREIWGVDGVVDVVNSLVEATAPEPA